MQIPILKLQSYRPPDFLAWKMEKSLVSQDFSLIVRFQINQSEIGIDQKWPKLQVTARNTDQNFYRSWNSVSSHLPSRIFLTS